MTFVILILAENSNMTAHEEEGFNGLMEYTRTLEEEGYKWQKDEKVPIWTGQKCFTVIAAPDLNPVEFNSNN